MRTAGAQRVQISDQTQSVDIDRRERQLSILVSVAFLIMAGGMVLLMYPVVFSHDDFAGKRTLRVAFFGFCILSVLLVGYFLERQRTIRKLRDQLVSELQRQVEVRRQASADLLQTLPDLSHFQDSLTMQFRRALSSEETLSVIVVALKPSRSTSDKNETLAAFGDAAKAMSRKLRAEDSIFQLQSGHFGIVLPGIDTAGAYDYAHRLEEGLQDTAGVTGRFAFDLRVLNYPEHAGSAHELEEIVRNLLSARPLELAGV
jgi:GGDEF domain-containing protein